MNKPKKQHTVPNCYLKRFINSEDDLWVYDREKNEYRKESPGYTTAENHFYCFDDEDGNKSYLVEELLAKEVELKLPSVIEKIDNSEPITMEERGRLATFASFQYFRTRAFKNDYIGFKKQLIEHMIRMALKDEKTAKIAMKKAIIDFEKNLGKKLNISPDELLAFANNSKIDVEIPKEAYLHMMIDFSEKMRQYFMQMDWLILKAPLESSFVTSDDPFLISPGKEHPPFLGVSLLTKDAEKIIPLSPKSCLIMLNKGNRAASLKIDKKAVRDINCRIASNCNRYLIGRDKQLLESLVKITKIDTEKRKPRFKFIDWSAGSDLQ